MANALATLPAKPATAKQAPAPMIPFLRGAAEHTEPFYDSSFVMGASSQNLGPVDVASYGFARAILVHVTFTSAGNAATVALQPDNPWSVFAELAVQDVNGAPLFGPHAGYECYLHHKYGGFRNQVDPKLYPTFSALTVGAGATAGSGSFMFRINLERNPRDGLGSLANMNASQSYKVRGSIAAQSAVFSTAPTTGPTVRVRMFLEAYSQPNSTDMEGRPQATFPPANQTTGFSSRIVLPMVSGANTFKHTRVGNYLRNLIYVFRDAGGARTGGQAAVAGQNFQWFVDSRLLTNKLIDICTNQLTDWYDLTNVTLEGANGPDNGVIVLPFMVEFDGRAGYEMRDLWLPTTQATRLELQVTTAAAGTVTIMTDDIAPRGNVFIS